jgi:GT2 family glycosyltransferase
MTLQRDLSVSLIVLNWNGKEHLVRCLPSLLALDYSNYEVILVDNGSTDGSVEYVASEFPRVKVIENGRNLGYAGGMNVGIAQSEGDVVILLNNDVIVRRDWLSELMGAMAADERIGIAGCKIFFADGETLQHAGGFVSYPLAFPDHYGYRQPDTGAYDALADVDYVTSAAMAIRRAALAEVGDLDDEFYPIYYDDVDICYRARPAGWRVVYVPTAVLTHLESATMVRESYSYFASFHRSRLRFVLKYLSAEQFLKEFAPAEAAWLAQAKSPQERRALSRAYRAALLMTPAIYAAREGCSESAFAALQEVTVALVGLQANVWKRSCEPRSSVEMEEESFERRVDG